MRHRFERDTQLPHYVGTGKELSIREVAEKIMAEIGFKGELRWDASKPDGTLRKLTDVPNCTTWDGIIRWR